MDTRKSDRGQARGALRAEGGAAGNALRAGEGAADDALRTVLDYLCSVPAWYLASCENDQPHVRPFSFATLQDGRVWLCTATTKDVYRELQANPKLEASAWKPGSGWLVLRGKADFGGEAGKETRAAGYEHLSALGENYEGPEDDRLAFFFVSEPRAWICDIDGSWNRLRL